MDMDLVRVICVEIPPTNRNGLEELEELNDTQINAMNGSRKWRGEQGQGWPKEVGFLGV